LLEKNRLLDALQQNDSVNGQDAPLFLDQVVIDREDPSAVFFQEDWEGKVARIQAASPFGSIEGWGLLSVIVKSGSDMRQEQLACQVICEMTNVWRKAGLPLWTYCYRVLVASCNGGLIETVPNAISLHSIKKTAYLKHKNSPNFVFSLRDHFIKTFGSPDSEPFQKARDCFTESLAAYSIATYLLQVKDRHDGNILLDNKGHLVHIDFGFMLSNSPGYVGFESAPFKLSPEYIELLGGLHSPEFAKFKDLMFQGFLELRKHVDRIAILIEIMQKESRLPCFYSGESAVAHLRQRFHLTLTDAQLRQVVDRLIISSAYNIFTKLYDTFQYYSNGIL
jgi:phosphatidylinositol kinase/protein kinase (PI-3  family)